MNDSTEIRVTKPGMSLVMLLVGSRRVVYLVGIQGDVEGAQTRLASQGWVSEV